MAKYYAVRKGKEPGIYSTWDECSAQVTGYKGAEYKKFDTKKEAQSFIREGIPYSEIKSFDRLPEDEMICYVDGSYDAETNRASYGVVSFTSDGKKSYRGVVEGMDPVHRNVTGEVAGALFAMEKALDNKKDRLILHFDYAGIEKWATGEWKTNRDLTKMYKKKFDEYSKDLDTSFIKVKAHSGDIYNEEADTLAKEALGLA